MRHRLEFYFDFISPFGYLASLRVDELAEQHQYECRWQSMLLGISVLKTMGMRPLTEIPLKSDYLRIDLQRYLRRHGLALARAHGAPPANPLPAARAFYLIDQDNPILAKQVAKAILNAYWREGADIGSQEAVIAIARGAGADGAGLERDFASGEASRLLHAAVDRSLARGVFGSPFFIVDEEPFFGLEKMELMEEWLARGGW